MADLHIQQISILGDNYVYLIHDPGSAETVAIDPAVAAPVMEALDARGWRLTRIFSTHHHVDHVGGNLELKRATGCRVTGAASDARRIPGIDEKVSEGDVLCVGERRVKVLEVPGHTSGHVAYWFEGEAALFCGDTLFSLGCGRLFEGTAAEMWSSLVKLRALPDETRVYCAHEYTSANADFALTQEPDNAALRARADEVLKLREAGKPSVPSTLESEKAANPFLRADVPEFLVAAGLQGKSPVEAFAEIRKQKDHF
jgi:hydroxyacylglutathione hydrolase